jgi:hypothetical protein
MRGRPRLRRRNAPCARGDLLSGTALRCDGRHRQACRLTISAATPALISQRVRLVEPAKEAVVKLAAAVLGVLMGSALLVPLNANAATETCTHAGATYSAGETRCDCPGLVNERAVVGIGRTVLVSRRLVCNRGWVPDGTTVCLQKSYEPGSAMAQQDFVELSKVYCGQ